MSQPSNLATVISALDSGAEEFLRRGSVEIWSQNHSGLRQEFSSKPTTVGAGLDCDLVLTGEGLSETHANFALTGLAGERLTVEALGGPVDLGEHGTLAPGFSIDVRLPVTLRMGNAEFRFSGSLVARHMPSRKFMALGLGAAASLLLVISGAGVSGAVSGALHSSKSGAPSAMSQTLDREKAIERVRALLDQSGLASRISVTTDASGTLVLKGKIEGRQAATAWREVLKTLDGVSGFPPLMRDVVVSEAEAKPPAIASVWFGASPHVILKDGVRLSIGDTSAEGWRLEDIDTLGVLFKTPDGTAVRLSLNAS